MKVIAKISNSKEKVDLYFGINEGDLKRPFILGGCSNDKTLPSIAQWGAASSFGLDNLNNIDGAKWKDWRASLSKLGCDWVIPIIERAEASQNIKSAVTEILQKNDNI